MELKRETRFNVNISTETEVLTYTYSGDQPREVIARVDLGDDSKPLSGVGGVYVLNFYIDGVVISPSSEILVSSGRTKSIMVSRQIPLEPNDVVSIRVKGVSGDVQVNTVSSLRDATPIRTSDVVGTGAVQVDHNYGGTDALTIMTTDNVRIDNATIRAYRKADYDAGNRTPEFVVGQTVTNVDGAWTTPIMLDPGQYVLLVYRQGVIQAKTHNLTVS